MIYLKFPATKSNGPWHFTYWICNWILKNSLDLTLYRSENVNQASVRFMMRQGIRDRVESHASSVPLNAVLMKTPKLWNECASIGSIKIHQYDANGTVHLSSDYTNCTVSWILSSLVRIEEFQFTKWNPVHNIAERKVPGNIFHLFFLPHCRILFKSPFHYHWYFKIIWRKSISKDCSFFSP